MHAVSVTAEVRIGASGEEEDIDVRILNHDVRLSPSKSSIDSEGFGDICDYLRIFLQHTSDKLGWGKLLYRSRGILPRVCKAFLPWMNVMHQIGDQSVRASLVQTIKKRLCRQVPVEVEIVINDDAEETSYNLGLRLSSTKVQGSSRLLLTFTLFERWTLIIMPSIYHITSYYHNTTEPADALLMVQKRVLNASCANDLEEKQKLDNWIQSQNEMCANNVFMSLKTLKLMGVNPNLVE